MCLMTGTLLGPALWPGRTALAANRPIGPFTFVALNDTHFQTDRCGAWFDRVLRRIKSHRPRPAFCLVLGDLSEHGTSLELAAMQDSLRQLPGPWHAVPGNHDYETPTSRTAYDTLYPGQANYWFLHRGWQFVGLDTTDGNKYVDTRIQPAVFRWLEAQASRLDPTRPTVVFTHFPLARGVAMRPANAEDLLARFEGWNLMAVLSGHYHGLTENRCGRAVLTTGACCAHSRENADGTQAKGYLLCEAAPEGLRHQFVEVDRLISAWPSGERAAGPSPAIARS